MRHGNGGSIGALLLGMLIGLALGAGVTLMVSPKSGEDIRREIRQTAADVRHRAEDTVSDLRDRAEETAADVRRRTEKVAAEARQRTRG